MGNDKRLFLWSDGWCIDSGKAWFVSGIGNILFCLDFQTRECDYVAQIPKGTGKFRVNPRCAKWKNDIFCMPDKGSRIWVYNIERGNFIEIRVRNIHNVRLEFDAVWMYGNQLFGVSYGLREIVRIDADEKEIINCYRIDSSGFITSSIRVKNEIYVLYGNGKIYQFNMETGEALYYQFPQIERKFHALCYDNKKFWIGGYRKELYVWDKEKNEIVVKDNFPEGIGRYSFKKDTDGKLDDISTVYDTPVFQYIVSTERSIWFIPKQANKIIYADKNNQELHTFEIEDDQESRESLLKNECGMRYILEYVIDKRYIGLFSLKSQSILEIDTMEMKYRWCDYYFTDNCLRKLSGMYGNTFKEGCVLQRDIYSGIIQAGGRYLANIKKRECGIEIYQKMTYKS